MNNQKIGNFIRSLRKEKNLTQKELAEKLNITDRAISRWERGIGCPDISLLEELSKILDITVLELLKGEHLKENGQPTNKNIIESIHYGKENTLIWIKKITNYLTTIIIISFSLFIILTNIKSISLGRKTYNYKSYLLEREEQITVPPTVSMEDIINDFNTKIETILSTQGNYNDKDYSTIKTHINVLKEEIHNQNNSKYITKLSYSWKDLITFYLDHQNLKTPLLDHKDLYSIIISYKPSLSENLIWYSRKEDSTFEIYYQLYNYLKQPYYIHSITPYQNYTPNPYFIIECIYNKELQLLNDIMKAGDIQ